MRPGLFMPLALAAIVVAGCSGATTVPSTAAPTTAPTTSAPAAEPVASATPAPTPDPVSSPTAAPSAIAGCLDKVVHAVLYKGLKDPGSLTEGDIATLQAGFEAWDPGEDRSAVSNREWFLKESVGMVEKVAGAIMLRAGQETIEACP